MDFWKRWEKYVRSYLPGWRYELDGEEPEAALMTALGILLEDTGIKMKRLPEKYELEFLRGFGFEPQEKVAARAYAALTAIERSNVPSGSSFYLEGDGTKIWTTESDASAESISLLVQVFAGGGCGKLIINPPPQDDYPVKLMDFSGPGAQKREAKFSHPDAFASVNGCKIRLNFTSASKEMLDLFSDKASALWFLDNGESDEVQLENPLLEGQALCFTLPSSENGNALILRIQDGCTPPEEPVGFVTLDAERTGLSPDAVVTDEGPCQGEKWLPFGEDVEPWKSCRIACADVFSLKGAEVTLSWTLELQAEEYILPGMDKEPEYKMVMLHMPPQPPKTREVYADAVAWEYWNGNGWRPLNGAEKYSLIFGSQEEEKAQISAKFIWPEDAAACEMEGVYACWLRWRVLRAEGYGWLPRRSYAPEVTDMRVSAVINGAGVQTEHICGLEDVFTVVTERQPLFPALSGSGDEWWLGFDAPPGGDILDIYFAIRGRTTGVELTAFEDGGHELSIQDGTSGLANTGVVSLSGIEGKMSTLFGMECWWLCFRDMAGGIRRGGQLPVLKSISCGAALLKSEDGSACSVGDTLQPLRGGIVSGVMLSDSFGGLDKEDDRIILRNARERRHHMGKAVSALDIDQLLRAGMWDIVRTNCVRSGNVMEIGVLMREIEHHSTVFSFRQNGIQKFLEEKSVLPSLGLDINVREPRFYMVNASVWVRLPKGAGFISVKNSIHDALDKFLQPVSGNFHGKGWRIGELPSFNQIRNCIQSVKSGIELVELTVTVTTPEGREKENGSVHDHFALPLSGCHTVYEIKKEAGL